MDDRSHLHDAEVLLCSLRSSPAMLLWLAVRGILDAVIIGAILSVVLFLVSVFFDVSLGVWMYAVLFVVTYAYVLWQRWRVWNHALFRITSERILLQDPHAFFHSPLRTVKWSQYQESYTGHQPQESTQRPHESHHHVSQRQFFDYFFGSRPICIRYGTADARFEAEFPSLRYAHDVKHYLDKVDSAVRRNDLSSIKPFVAKPKGKRDEKTDN